MRRILALFVFILLLLPQEVKAQGYVLKDHRDTVIPNVLFDTMPLLVDSFFNCLLREEQDPIKKFVPDVKFLKSTYDTLNVDYNEANALYRQQYMQRNLELQYKRMMKKVRKKKINLKKLEMRDLALEYAIDPEWGIEICYVTLQCIKGKNEYEIKFACIKLNGKWFLADELALVIL